MRLSLIFVTVAMLVGLASPGGSQTTVAPRTIRILFVGNSFTHGKWEPVLQYNRANVVDENAHWPAGDPRAAPANEPGPWGGIAGIFGALSSEAGLKYDVHMEAVSGKTLRFHVDYEMPVITRAGWDVVVLQALSTEPVPVAVRKGQREQYLRDAVYLEQRIHEANPAAQIFLYETWPRADLIYPADKPYSGTKVSIMAGDLHAGAAELLTRDRNIAGAAMAGDAWIRAIDQHVAEPDPYHAIAGQLDLWGEDNYHPSIYGAYLNALVLYASITGLDPRTFGASEKAAADLGIAPAIAATLQRIAYETFSAAPRAR